MKLRNKKTGKILHEVRSSMTYKDVIRIYDETSDKYYSYNSLAELNKEWEDYEEPETFWYMTAWGDVKEYSQDQFAIKQKQEIGNYFDTREEAEKAVEKLKAWKRLKDKGFRFDCWDENHHNLGIIEFSFPNVKNSVYDFQADLDLLFGSEE